MSQADHPGQVRIELIIEKEVVAKGSREILLRKLEKEALALSKKAAEAICTALRRPNPDILSGGLSWEI